jgi:hypothetical protein
MLVELRRQVGEFLLHGLESGFLRVGQLRTAEPEIAQLVVDHPSFGRTEHRELGRGPQRAILVEQPQVLPEVGIERRHLRQIGVIRLAQLRRIHDGVQMAHRAPRAVETIEPIRERHDDGLPRRGTRVRGHGFDDRARGAEQVVDGGGHV